MRHTLIAAALLVPFAAHAQSLPEPRDIYWYMSHPDIMQKTLMICHSNVAYANTEDCQNAERASAGNVARSHRAASAMPGMNDPAYWSQNRIARDGILEQCRRRGPGDALAYPYCRPAAVSALQDLSSR